MRPLPAILAALFVSACVTTTPSDPAAEAVAKRFEPVADKGTVYIYRRQQIAGSGGLETLFIDGRLIGNININNFLVATAIPGEHGISAQMGGMVGGWNFSITAGEVMYLRTSTHLGWSANVIVFEPQPESVARHAIEALRFVPTAAVH